MKTYKIFLVLILCVSVCYAQDNTEQKAPQSISINLGQSSQNKFTKSNPAQVIATFPNNDTIADSYLINGFLEIEYLRQRTNTFSYTLGIAYEVQKNTLINKKQDVQQIGITASQIIANNYDDTQGQYIVSENVKYSQDFVNKTKAFQAHLGLKYEDFRPTHIFFVDGAIPLLGFNGEKDGLLSFRWDYNLGLGYIGGDEDVLMAKANFSISAFPFYGILNNWLDQPEIIYTTYVMDLRTPLIGNTDLRLNPKRTFSFGLAYVINKKNKIALGYNINKGADPFAGLDNQDFDTLTFQVTMSFGSN
ncbi:hypothetical protein [Psychroserpens sp. SPM9]|uniref:hypothetical protein n=1 Tax=Psychroserpens sp. SPM9 TaxID=2975598 RepID=UPI0021A4F5F5|nr:hypothetical protein [Psychroserpens sp. SPM9]MDG5493178.1 hypothetical protein [Psychroserpens sp. SPM9]